MYNGVNTTSEESNFCPLSDPYFLFAQIQLYIPTFSLLVSDIFKKKYLCATIC